MVYSNNIVLDNMIMGDKYMKTRMKFIAVAASAALLMSACTTTAENTNEEVKEEVHEEVVLTGTELQLSMLEPAAYSNIDGLELEPGTYISIVGKSADQSYWKAVEQGAKQAIADLNEKFGYEGSDKIKFVYSGPEESYDVDEQVNILDEELARYPHALGIALVDAQSCGVQFDLAAQNGISIVTFDTTSNYQDVMARIETDNVEAAVEAAAGLARAMGEMGEVVLLIDDSKAATAKEREDAFVKEITENHPGITIGNIYHDDNLDEVKEAIVAEIRTGTYEPATLELEEGAEVTLATVTKEEVYNYIFQKGTDIAGVYTTSSKLMETAIKYCEKYGRADIEIVGFDANEAQIEALKEGKAEGLILQNPYGMGYATVVACARSIMNEGNEAVVDSGYVWIDADNVEDEVIQSILY